MADSPLLATFRQPFTEQVAAWRIRMGNQVGTAAWDDLWQGQHDRAFVVAGALKADLLADLVAAVDKGITQGTTLEEFRRDFRRIVQERGWHGWTGEGSAKGEAWRTRVIYQTNMRTSYMAGRHAQLVAGNFKFWVYRHGGSREPRLHHLSWNGIALPPDHPFWATHYPPNGWGCSCEAYGARTEAGIRRLGGDPTKVLPDNWGGLDPRTGAPAGIDKGWAYAPGATVLDEVVRTMANKKLPALPPLLGAALIASAPPAVRRTLSDQFGHFIDEIAPGRIDKSKLIVVGGLQPDWLRALPEPLLPRSASVAVSQLNVAHTFRPGKAGLIEEAWYRRLPEHLPNPDWVILDRSKPERPVLLLGYRTDGGARKVVVTLDLGQRDAFGHNLVTSARRISEKDIRSMIGRLEALDSAAVLALIVGALS